MTSKKSLTDSTDDDLRQIAKATATVADRLEAAHPLGVLAVSETEALLRKLKGARDETRNARDELNRAAQVIEQLHEQLQRATGELAEKTAALRLVDPETVQRRVTDAKLAGYAEGVAASGMELGRLRAETAQQRSEIEDLRASKRKLREALDRAKEGR